MAFRNNVQGGFKNNLSSNPFQFGLQCHSNMIVSARFAQQLKFIGLNEPL